MLGEMIELLVAAFPSANHAVVEPVRDLFTEGALSHHLVKVVNILGDLYKDLVHGYQIYGLNFYLISRLVFKHLY